MEGGLGVSGVHRGEAGGEVCRRQRWSVGLTIRQHQYPRHLSVVGPRARGEASILPRSSFHVGGPWALSQRGKMNLRCPLRFALGNEADVTPCSSSWAPVGRRRRGGEKAGGVGVKSAQVGSARSVHASSFVKCTCGQLSYKRRKWCPFQIFPLGFNPDVATSTGSSARHIPKRVSSCFHAFLMF